MKNSRITDATIAGWMQNNPTHISSKTGNIVTCPVRLSWINVLTVGKPQTRDDGSIKEGNYNTQIWFPPGCERGIYEVLVPELLKGVRKYRPNEMLALPQNPFAQQQFTPEWINAYYAAMQGITAGALHQPFRDQHAQEKYGATPGLPFLTCSTQNKPQVTDPAGNPIIDPARVYPGVWAIVSLNVYEFGMKPKRQPKNGVQFGLQSVMIVCDDEQLGSSAPPAADDFANVKISQTFDTTAAFSQRTSGGAAPSILPAATQVYKPPGAASTPAPPTYLPPQSPAPSYPPPSKTLAPGYTNDQALYGTPAVNPFD